MSTRAGDIKDREAKSGENTFALLLINKKSWWAHFMIVMVISGWMPINVAAFTAATIVALLGAVTMEEAYRSVEWKAIFLVAAIVILGIRTYFVQPFKIILEVERRNPEPLAGQRLYDGFIFFHHSRNMDIELRLEFQLLRVHLPELLVLIFSDMVEHDDDRCFLWRHTMTTFLNGRLTSFAMKARRNRVAIPSNFA